MDTASSDFTTEYHGICYHFCSQQCLENFTARPALYVGIKSPKQKGKSVIKNRSFTVDRPVPQSDANTLQTELCKMMGVQDVQVSETHVSVTYDLLEATAVQVEEALEQAGEKLGAGWSERLKRGWVHYTEENELDMLAAADGACCNRPPGRG